MSIEDLPLHPGLALAPAGCYLPPSIPLPAATLLAETADRLARQFPTDSPAQPGEVEMVAAGIAMGCTSPRWRQRSFWRSAASRRAHDFRQMAEYFVTPEAFEWARGRGWSAEWPREIHFQLPEPFEPLETFEHTLAATRVPREPGEDVMAYLQRVAEVRQVSNDVRRAALAYDYPPEPRRWIGILRTEVPFVDADAIEYDEIDGDFRDDVGDM